MATSKSAFSKVRLPIAQLIPNPRNARSHPEEQLAGLRASYRRFGQTRPVLARKENRMIVAGHGLWTAMAAEGADEVDVLLWDIDQKTADAYMVADNQHAKTAVDDLDRIAEILREQGGTDLIALGFSDETLAEVLGASDEAIVVEEVETTQLQARFWITVRGPMQQQAKALTRLKELMKDLPEVAVDLGSVIEA